jgi:hypothetical protein
MRQSLNPKKVAALALKLNLPIIHVLVRGATGHRQDLCLEDGSVLEYFPITGQMQKSKVRWALPMEKESV